MRVLVIGASGLIGGAICARLVAEGHQAIGISRTARRGLSPAEHIAFDIAAVSRAEEWLPLLRDIDAVVNCAGVLQDAPGESARRLHGVAPGLLFAACEAAGVRRVIHFSALGVERGATEFSRSKQEGDADLMGRDLDWVVLRPSVVVGRAAYGGSALLRGLAALPVLPVLPATGPLQLVHLDDVVATVLACLAPSGPTRVVLELVGPRRWSLVDAVRMLRRWLRWPQARTVPLPAWAAAALYRAGDALAWLGWRPPVRSTARLEIAHGAVGDGEAWRRETGIVGQDVEAAFAREPASVQERWFALLYLLKPLVFGVFGLFWIGTGLISFGPGWEIGLGLMREGGVGEPLASLAVISGASADLLIGLAILYRPTARWGLYAALVISVVYAVLGSVLVPRLWADPLGPMLKIWPIMVLNLVALAIREDR